MCAGRVRRLIQPVGIVFKGPGFYVTDNGKPSPCAEVGKKEATEKVETPSSDTGKTET